MKREALEWKALETRRLGLCEVTRGDDGDDVFVLGSSLDETLNYQDDHN